MDYPVVENAISLGSIASLGLVLARLRSGRVGLPLLLAVLIGYAFMLRVLHPDFIVDSLIHDVPWFRAGLLGIFCALGASGMVRTNSWFATVLGAAMVGNVAIAAGLALVEPNAGRRAKLVVASTGASLLSPWSGVTPLALGYGGLEIAALGLCLAAVGLVWGGSTLPTFAKPNVREGAWTLSLFVWLAGLAWVFALAGVPDFAASGLESLPPMFPGRATVWLGAVAVILGAIGYEPAVAMVAADVLDHASQLRGAWAADAIRVGLSVGAGLPMLIVTRCQLRVGLPLWLAQVVLALGFLWIRAFV